MQLSHFLRKQNGDTIVEVLISIAIVSAVLGSAYAITNRNVENSQQAQEHSQALKVAETQLEQLKSYLSSGGAEPADQENFCMNLDTSTSPSTNEKVVFSGYTGPASPLPTVDANYPSPKCRKDDSGAVTARYMTGVKRAGDTYTTYVSWDGPTGNREQLSLVYKVYP